MLKSPSLRHRGERHVGGKEPPGREQWSTLAPSWRDAAKAPVASHPRRGCLSHAESVAALPVVLRGANGAAAPRKLSLPLPNLYRRGNRLRSVAC